MKLFSQNDTRWKSNLLGNSNLTIGSSGCLITSLGMISDTNVDVVNTKLKAVKGFTEALVIWNKIQSALPKLKFVWRGPAYNNDSVLSQIKRNGFCLVEAKNRFTGSKHWMVFIGNKKLWDPWTGTEKSTGSYNNLLWSYSGFAAIDKI